MKVAISSRQLDILRKTVYGLTIAQIARELMIHEKDVDSALKKVMKSTGSKEPVQAMQNLAKNGFSLIEEGV